MKKKFYPKQGDILIACIPAYEREIILYLNTPKNKQNTKQYNFVVKSWYFDAIDYDVEIYADDRFIKLF